MDIKRGRSLIPPPTHAIPPPPPPIFEQSKHTSFTPTFSTTDSAGEAEVQVVGKVDIRSGRGMVIPSPISVPPREWDGQISDSASDHSDESGFDQETITLPPAITPPRSALTGPLLSTNLIAPFSSTPPLPSIIATSSYGKQALSPAHLLGGLPSASTSRLSFMEPEDPRATGQAPSSKLRPPRTPGVKPNSRNNDTNSNWISLPRPTPLSDQAAFPHLPALQLTTSREDDPSPHPYSRSANRTSNPLGPSTNQIQQEMEFSIQKLQTPTVFAEFLKDPYGLHCFRDFLRKNHQNGSSLTSLELYGDLHRYNKETERVQLVADALEEVYFGAGATDKSGARMSLSWSMYKESLIRLQATREKLIGLHPTEIGLLESLFQNEFQAFVRFKLLEFTSVQLGKHGLNSTDRKGLGDCFVMSNPRLPDCPVVLVSPGFTMITGYTPDQIIGRNCRFLQGPATSPSSVKTIRMAVDNGEGCTQLLLNYRLDKLGNRTAFWNLLCILPLRDSGGDLIYFIGGQTDVTGQLATSSLASLLGERDPSFPVTTNDSYSPEVQARLLDAKYGSVSTQEKGFVLPETRARTASFPGSGRPDSPNGILFKENPAPASRLGSFFKKFTNGKSPTSSMMTMSFEDALHDDALVPASLEYRIQEFSGTYERVVFIKPAGREILFVTPAFHQYLGLGSNSINSPLIHRDFLDLFTSETSKEEAKLLRQRVKGAISAGTQLSLQCQLQGQKKSILRNTQASPVVRGTLHLTPLSTTSEVEAFVAVFA